MLTRNKIKLLIVYLICQSCALLPFQTAETHAKKAERLVQEAKLQEAITEYHLHMEERLKSKNRPAEENPYFYLVLIGDLYVQLQNLEEAQRFYISAMARQVPLAIVLERIKLLGRKYAEKRLFNEAFRLLTQYRDLDPLIFDIEIDETHKAQIKFDREINNRP